MTEKQARLMLHLIWLIYSRLEGPRELSKQQAELAREVMEELGYGR